MKELNLSVYTGEKGENKVTMTATFETHADAVSFHEGIAKLCRDASKTGKDGGFQGHMQKLIGK